MAKLTLDFAGMEDFIDEFRKLGENVEKTTEECLQQSVEVINEELHTEMRKHHITGETDRSLREGEKVKWNGDKASIKYGFNVKKGGLPAVFLERGRPHQRPTPVINPALDRADGRVRELQEEALRKAMNKSK